MISVVKVFNTLRDLCNEDQRGFITPEVFNSFAPLVQENVYEKMKSDLLNTVRLRKSNMDLGGVDSRNRELKEVMSDYIREETIASNNNYFNKPHDLDKIISVHAGDTATTLRSDESVQCDIVHDLEKISMLVRSNLSSPTESFPVALVHSKIEVLPDTIDLIHLMYYRRPTSIQGTNTLDRNSVPRYAVSGNTTGTFGTTFGLDTSLTRNFDLPTEYYDEVILEFAEMMGVRLRDPIIAGYSTQEQVQS